MHAPFVLNKLLLTVELPEVIHIIQALHFRLWWLIPTTIFCGFLEVVGWSCRLWSSRHPFLFAPFIIQWVHFGGRLWVLCSWTYRILTLVLAPTPLVAANFILLGCVIHRLGPQYSRLTPRRCESHIRPLFIRELKVT
jgi:RTA1 like protein